MQKFRLITALRFLDIADEVESPFCLMPGIDLITNKDKIKSYLNEELKSVAGIIEYNYLLNSNHLLVCDADQSVFPNMNSNEALVIWLVWLDMLINDCWLVKDNGIACEVAFSKMTKGDHTEWSSNFLAYSPSVSNGKQFENTFFTLADLVQWELLSNKVQTYRHSKKSSTLSSFIGKEYSRIARSMTFISAARREKHVAIKIAHYCSAFESLFSTDNAELSHKLSERVALFLKPFGFDPLTVFDDMKSFYNIRSKVTHGDSVQGSKEAEIPVLSEKCDSYLRSIVNLIINDESLTILFDGNNNYFEEYFKKQLLTG